MAQQRSINIPAQPLGSHTQNASLSSAVTLAAPAGATQIMIQAFDQHVRITLDGTAPTTTKGFRIAAGDPPVILFITPESTVKLIEEAATATAEIQWLGW